MLLMISLVVSTLLTIHHVSALVSILDIGHFLQPNLIETLLLSTDDRPFAPWSHKPHCTTATTLAYLGQKFCVYTSNTTGPHGLSLVLKPNDASLATKHLNDIPLSSFVSREEAENLYLRPSPWKMVDLPGKGKGVVATRKIMQYETFIIDQAALVADQELESALGRKEKNELLKLAVDNLLLPDMVRDMSSSHGDGRATGEDHGRLEEDIMITNAFGSTVAGVGSRTLFPLISRVNHACSPNSFVLFSKAGISMAVKAYRNIEPGEEITISYLLLGLPSSQRKHQLRRWGFECSCSLCTLPSGEKKASDLRRLMIRHAEKKILELAEAYKIDEAINLARESIDMIQEEGGLHSLLTDEYAMLAMLHLEKGDRQKAEVYGELAWDLLGKLGYLGVGKEKEKFGLETLLRSMGKIGGEGKGWKHAW